MTKYREPNMVKWVGVRPGHNGDQVYADGIAQNNTQVLYTVPADKILLLFNWGTTTFWTAGTNYVYLSIYDDTPAVVLNMVNIYMGGTTHVHDREGNYKIPIEIPATYSLRLYSMAAGCYISGYIHGILVKA